MVSGDESNPITTTNTNEFDHYFFSYPLFFIEKDYLETENKIIMPPSALEQLLALPNVVHPMLFRLENSNTGLYTHCGVGEFTAEEGLVYLPTWMMENMQLQEGDLVNIKNTSLPQGTSITIQPHATKFITLPDHKLLLEEAIMDFACLTTGDTIVIEHEGEEYMIDIIETKPSPAISLFESDCVLEFEPPLDYKEPENMRSVSEDDEKLEGAMEPKDDKSSDEFTGKLTTEESSVANEQQTEFTPLFMEGPKEDNEQPLPAAEVVMELEQLSLQGNVKAD